MRRLPCTFSMKYCSIFSVTVKSAITPSFMGASDNILAGGVALTQELDGVPDGLATTDRTVHEIAVGATRYAGSVAKLLG